MKLIFCRKCYDVFKLITDEPRSCLCGACVGKYNADGHTAVTNGEGVCLALDNNKLSPLLHTREEQLKEKIQRYAPTSFAWPVTCWARPHDGIGNPRSSVDKQLRMPDTSYNDEEG